MINNNFLKLQSSYLFSTVARKVREYREEHPEAQIVSLGIGDVTQPLPLACREAMHKAVDELGSTETFRGYGPEQGYEFLRQAIVDHDYRAHGIEIDLDEVFISDGAKSDCGNIGDIFSPDCRIAVTDPVYPVYVDSNVMSGRAGEFTNGKWSNIYYMPVTEANGFKPALPIQHVDLIYLCYPNNPTGTVLTRTDLKEWVRYAEEHGCIIFYDSAYEAYIQDDNGQLATDENDIPHTIYEIPGANRVAIEFRSYSKTAGFTGVRCGYTVVPKSLKFKGTAGVSLNSLWNRRQCTKFNGTSYITQRAAEAIYSAEGQQQVRATIGYYMQNARYMRQCLQEAGFTVYGGEHAPYIWLRVPEGYTSWDFFDYLLTTHHLVTTPGSGFGPAGEGFVRLTAFGRKEDCEEAMRRITQSTI